MNAIKSLFRVIFEYFTSGRAKADIEKVESIVFAVAPFLESAAAIAAGIDPGLHIALDVIAGIKAKYPGLFDGSQRTTHEKNLYMLGIAGDLVEAHYPNIDTTIARSAVQLAFLGNRK